MKRVSGTAQLTAARSVLSDTQLEAFFHAAGAEEVPRATRLVSIDLKKGYTLDHIFADFPNNGDPMHSLFVDLKVKRLAPRTFHIRFGFSGANLGDSGEWRIVYGAKGSVVRIVGIIFWIN